MKGYKKIPCVIQRGGTSKGVYLHDKDLPKDPKLREKILLAIFGSPDLRQIDGLGGADPLTSKCAIIGPSKRQDADVDYTIVVDGETNDGTITYDEDNDLFNFGGSGISNTTLSSPTLTGVVDMGGATSVEIVSGANPTTNADGEIAIDTDDSRIEYYDGSLDFNFTLSLTVLSYTVFEVHHKTFLSVQEVH